MVGPGLPERTAGVRPGGASCFVPCLPCRTGYGVCRAPCKVKMRGCLFRRYLRISRRPQQNLQPSEGPSGVRGLCVRPAPSLLTRSWLFASESPTGQGEQGTAPWLMWANPASCQLTLTRGGEDVCSRFSFGFSSRSPEFPFYVYFG